MNRERFRTIVKWFGLLLIANAGAMIVLGVFASSTLQKLEDNELISAAHTRMLFLDVILWLVFSFFYFKLYYSFSDKQREIKNAMKSDDFSILKYYRQTELVTDVWRMLILALIQLPFVIFFALWGLSYLYSTFVERFYALESGFYGAYGSALAGWLLCTAVFSVIFVTLRIFFLFLTAKKVQES